MRELVLFHFLRRGIVAFIETGFAESLFFFLLQINTFNFVLEHLDFCFGIYSQKIFIYACAMCMSVTKIEEKKDKRKMTRYISPS